MGSKVILSVFLTTYLPRILDIGTRSRLPAGTLGLFPNSGKSQRRKYVLCGDFSGRTCIKETEVTRFSWFICLAAQSLHTWICQKMASKVRQWWLVPFREGYLWSHKPACLPPSHQGSIDTACGVSQQKTMRRSSFFLPRPSHSFGVARGLDGGFLYFMKVKLGYFLTAVEKPCSHVWWWMFYVGPGILSFLFYLSLSSGMCFNRNSQRMTEEGGRARGCWLIQMRGLVSLSVCLQLRAHYCLCVSLPGPRLSPGLPFDCANSCQGKSSSWISVCSRMGGDWQMNGF